jgi:hypothetical protein
MVLRVHNPHLPDRAAIRYLPRRLPQATTQGAFPTLNSTPRILSYPSNTGITVRVTGNGLLEDTRRSTVAATTAIHTLIHDSILHTLPRSHPPILGHLVSTIINAPDPERSLITLTPNTSAISRGNAHGHVMKANPPENTRLQE